MAPCVYLIRDYRAGGRRTKRAAPVEPVSVVAVETRAELAAYLGVPVTTAFLRELRREGILLCRPRRLKRAVRVTRDGLIYRPLCYVLVASEVERASRMGVRAFAAALAAREVESRAVEQSAQPRTRGKFINLWR